MTRAANTTGTDIASDPARIQIGRLVKWRCPICGRKMARGTRCKRSEFQVDHLDPCAQGGANLPGNFIPMCGSCNATKNGHPALEGIALAILKTGAVRTLDGATARARRIMPRLEWLAVAVGAIIEGE